MSNPTADEITGYYQDRLIIQYAQKPKALGVIGALIAGLAADAIDTIVRDGFDVVTAVGKQLDIVGKLRGLVRYFFGLDLSKTYMQITTYGAVDMGTVNGIATYETSPQPPAWYTMTYEDFVSHTLLDGQFRRVIQFMAAVDSCDFAYSTLDDICFDFFAGNVNLIVTGTMAITYQHLNTDTDDLFEIINQMGLLPAPAGVSVTVQEVPHY